MRPLITPTEAERRLRVIFPKTAFDTVFSNPLAGTAIAALIYVDAVCSWDAPLDTVHWANPSTVYWMSKEALAHASEGDRLAWRAASTSAKGNQKITALHKSWNAPFTRFYLDNTRETLRDETFRKWHEHNALRKRPDVAVSSSKGRWALYDDFADLFDPRLGEEQFQAAATDWRERRLDPGARLKALFALNRETAQHSVKITLPDATTRTLEFGHSSLILKGVIESWAPARLVEPVVLAISEPGVKVHIADAQLLQSLTITMDVNRVLPDALLADIGRDPVHFWIIEAVATDGPIDEARRKQLLEWARRQNIPPDRCSFLSAFLSRNDAAARRRLKDLATGTWAWYADEPGHELAWYQLIPGSD